MLRVLTLLLVVALVYAQRPSGRPQPPAPAPQGSRPPPPQNGQENRPSPPQNGMMPPPPPPQGSGSRPPPPQNGMRPPPPAPAPQNRFFMRPPPQGMHPQGFGGFPSFPPFNFFDFSSWPMPPHHGWPMHPPPHHNWPAPPPPEEEMSSEDEDNFPTYCPATYGCVNAADCSADGSCMLFDEHELCYDDPFPASDCSLDPMIPMCACMSRN